MCLSTTPQQQGNQLPQILLMEDEVNVAKGLKLVLSEAGYEVDWAETGKRALELCRRKSYDLMLADLLLPDIDGLEVIKEVRQQRPRNRGHRHYRLFHGGLGGGSHEVGGLRLSGKTLYR